MHNKTPNDALDRLSVEEFKAATKLPVHLVLDNVRSALNIGSAFRSMDAFRGLKIHLCGISATPPNREINKTALGAAHSVEWEYHQTTMEALSRLKRDGVGIFAVEQAQNSIALVDFVLPATGNIALVLGNEVEGVSPEVVATCDGCIEIGQYGTKHSINIAVCTGIVLWHLSRQFDYAAR